MSIDRTPPVTTICIHYGNSEAQKLLPPVGDSADYSCPKCGNYRVSSAMQMMIENGHADPRLARLVVENGRIFLRPTGR
jgi:hypothetical protein